MCRWFWTGVGLSASFLPGKLANYGTTDLCFLLYTCRQGNMVRLDVHRNIPKELRFYGFFSLTADCRSLSSRVCRSGMITLSNESIEAIFTFRAPWRFASTTVPLCISTKDDREHR